MSHGARKLVLDFTVIHPSSGSTEAKWNKNALAWKVRDKWNRHGPAYAVLSLAFAACAMTTYGQMDAHLLRLLHIFARKRAEMARLP